MDIASHRASILLNSTVNGSVPAGASGHTEGPAPGLTLDAHTDETRAGFQAIMQAFERRGAANDLSPPGVSTQERVNGGNEAAGMETAAKSGSASAADSSAAFTADLVAAQQEARVSLGDAAISTAFPAAPMNGDAASTLHPSHQGVRTGADDTSTYSIGPMGMGGHKHHRVHDGSGTAIPGPSIDGAPAADGAKAWSQMSASEKADWRQSYDSALDASGSTAMRSWQMGFVAPADMTDDQLKWMVNTWNDAASQRNAMLQNFLPDGSTPLAAEAAIYQGLVQDALAQAAPYAAELQARGIS